MSEAISYRHITILICERGYYTLGNYYKTLKAAHEAIDKELDYI